MKTMAPRLSQAAAMIAVSLVAAACQSTKDRSVSAGPSRQPSAQQPAGLSFYQALDRHQAALAKKPVGQQLGNPQCVRHLAAQINNVAVGYAEGISAMSLKGTLQPSDDCPFNGSVTVQSRPDSQRCMPLNVSVQPVEKIFTETVYGERIGYRWTSSGIFPSAHLVTVCRAGPAVNDWIVR